jgi:ADP-ribosylglycohydrolase
VRIESCGPDEDLASIVTIDTRDRYRGALLGLACGDALGTTLEFKPPGSFTPITDMVGGGPFRLRPGQWTDDTSMALCLAESLIERCTFDDVDQLERYVRWWRNRAPQQHGRLLRHRYPNARGARIVHARSAERGDRTRSGEGR